MNTYLEDKLGEYLAIRKLFSDYPAIVALIPKLSIYAADLLHLILDILAEKDRQAIDITGFALEKKDKRLTFNSLIYDSSKRILAYAVFMNDNILKQKINFKPYEIKRMADTDIIDLCNETCREGTAHITNLADFGLTPLMLSDLEAAGNDYMAIVSDPRNAILERKTITSNIKNLFHQADDLLKNKIDISVELISEQEPAFYQSYKNARTIIHLGYHEVSIQGKIFDSATKTPIQDAKVEIVELAKSYITREHGFYHFKSLHSGAYTIQISKPNYKQQTLLNIPVQEKITYHRDVYLERGNLNFAILPETDIIVWHGPASTNLSIIVKNTSGELCDIVAYITLSPSDPIPSDAITLHQNNTHKFNLADWEQAAAVYLHLKNPSHSATAEYLLLFETIINE